MSATASELVLPALHSLGQLANTKPLIVIDSRENLPLVFTRLQSVEGTLYSGDYSIRALEDSFSVERKSIEDIVSCCMGQNRERFERELHRLRGFKFKKLVIIVSRCLIETQRYRSRIAPAAVLGTLSTYEVRVDIPIVYCVDPKAAALQIESWAYFFCREHIKVANELMRSGQAGQSEGT